LRFAGAVAVSRDETDTEKKTCPSGRKRNVRYREVFLLGKISTAIRCRHGAIIATSCPEPLGPRSVTPAPLPVNLCLLTIHRTLNVACAENRLKFLSRSLKRDQVVATTLLLVFFGDLLGEFPNPRHS